MDVRTKSELIDLFIKRISVLNGSFSYDQIIKSMAEKNEVLVGEYELMFPGGSGEFILLLIDKLNGQINFVLPEHGFSKKIKAILMCKISFILENRVMCGNLFRISLKSESKFDILRHEVNQIMDLSGDAPTGFSYYSKRWVLSALYLRLIVMALRGSDIEKIDSCADRYISNIVKFAKAKASFIDFIKSKVG